jgi:hypothetical protein
MSAAAAQRPLIDGRATGCVFEPIDYMFGTADEFA